MLFLSSSILDVFLVGLRHQPKEIQFTANGKVYTFYLRSRGDLAVVYEVLYLRVYPVELFLSDGINTALDLGGHIGISAVFFTKELNLEKLVVLEPVASNFEILQRNISLNQLENRIIPIQAGIGLANQKVTINLSDSTNSHSVVFDNSTGRKEEIQLMDILSVQNESNIKIFDILKIDIEGYEYTVFPSLIQSLSELSVITIERHDLDTFSFQDDIENLILQHNFERKFIKFPGPVYSYVKKN